MSIRLQVNWRSEPDLLEGLNLSVRRRRLVSPARPAFGTCRCLRPDDDKRQTRLVEDRSNRPPLTIVDVTQWGRLKIAQKNYARFVAHEIRAACWLNPSSPTFALSNTSTPARAARRRHLHPGDRRPRRRAAHAVAWSLAGIPFSFHKQTGLWQSDEAIHLEVLLQTLARPEERSSFRKAACSLLLSRQARGVGPDARCA